MSAQAIATGKSWELAQEEKIRANGVGATIIALDDAAYPVQLEQIYAPPPILYIRGKVHCDLGRHLGGTRRNPRLALTPSGADASQQGQTASLFPGQTKLSPHESRIYAILRADESLRIDDIVERLEAELSSSEIFAALFELELAGKVRQLPGKNFVRSF